MTGSDRARGFRHPLAGSLLAFCLLPSLNLHPAQAAQFIPDVVRGADIASPLLHRLWSAELMRSLDLGTVTSFDDPVLPIAMLPADRLAALIPLAGATLAGQRFRRCIARNDVQMLREQIGDAVLDFVRYRAPAIHPGLDHETLAWPLSAAGEQVGVLGSALLARAFSEAAPPVARRAMLRLSPDAPGNVERLPLRPAEARQCALTLLQEIDPVWLSSFPVTL